METKHQLIDDETVKTVADVLKKYRMWIQVGSEGAPIEWDGITKLFPEEDYREAINRLENAVKKWDKYSDDLEQLGLLKELSDNYLTFLSNMRNIC